MRRVRCWRASSVERSSCLPDASHKRSLRPRHPCSEDTAEHASTRPRGGPVGMPVCRSRLLLAHGIWLRRHRELPKPQSPARGARSLRRTRREPWAKRRERSSARPARQPWAAAYARDHLSLRAQIATMAAGGMTNRDIGQHLYSRTARSARTSTGCFPSSGSLLGLSYRRRWRRAQNKHVSRTTAGPTYVYVYGPQKSRHLTHDFRQAVPKSRMTKSTSSRRPIEPRRSS